MGKTVIACRYTGTLAGDDVFSCDLSGSAGRENVYMQNLSTSYSGSSGHFMGNIVDADWVSAKTFVFEGTLKGTFESATAWSGTALSSRIETRKFISMADQGNATGCQKLTDLNSQSVPVGQVTLSGGTCGNSISINNANF